MTIILSPLKIIRFLLITVFLLLLAHIITLFLLQTYGFNDNKSIVRLFNLNTEQNIPTLFSFVILGVSAILFLIIYKTESIKTQQKYWLVLAFIFTFLALDEALSIHEIIGNIIQGKIQTKGVFYFAWIIPYGILLLILAAFYFRFILNLPKKITSLLLLSGVIFVGGAIGMEMVGAKIAEPLGTSFRENLSYMIAYTLEETMEMLGITLLIYTQLLYLKGNTTEPLKIRFQ